MMKELKLWNPNPSIKFDLQHERLGSDKQTIYISGQMTSGLRQALVKKWAGSNTEPAALSDARRAINDFELRFVRDTVQLKYPQSKIFAPFELDEAFPGLSAVGWDQPEFNAFWREFIIQSAKQVVFTPGWQYSRGGAWEGYVACCEQGIHCVEFDNPDSPLTIPMFRARIEEASQRLTALGESIEKVHTPILNAFAEEVQPPTMPSMPKAA